MVKWWNEVSNTALAAFLVRWLLGILFVMAGTWKVFVLTPAVHAQKMFVEGMAGHWIPDFLLTFFGMTIPFVELAAGIALLLGLYTRLTAFCVGLLLLITTYGHALQQPLFNIDGHTFTRMALVIFLLMIARGSDTILNMDTWLAKRK